MLLDPRVKVKCKFGLVFKESDSMMLFDRKIPSNYEEI